MKKVKKNKRCVYLDYNGTTPVYPSVLEAMMPYFTDHFGNPSSSHHFGSEPKTAVTKARRSLLRLIQSESATDPSSIIFTGCGTESNNVAIRLALLSSTHKANKEGLLHVVTTNIEHPAISQCLKSYVNGGMIPKIAVTEVPVDECGVVSTNDVINAIQDNTVLVTIMTANNEVGSLQPVFELAEICRQEEILFHTDAAQAVGKVDLHGLADKTIGADMITIVGHKFGAPKGIAALYIRPNCFEENGRINPENGASVLLMGGGQENGRRGGTENVPYIAGIGRAAELLLEQRGYKAEWQMNALKMEMMRSRLLQRITSALEEASGRTDIVRVNGPLDAHKRLPNTLSIGLKGVQSGKLLATIGEDIACSAGSACHSSSGSTASYSAILKAMNVPSEFAIGTLRLSVGPNTSSEDVDIAAEIIVSEAMRQLNS
jgi:cysteine desulfurase